MAPARDQWPQLNGLGSEGQPSIAGRIDGKMPARPTHRSEVTGQVNLGPECRTLGGEGMTRS